MSVTNALERGYNILPRLVQGRVRRAWTPGGRVEALWVRKCGAEPPAASAAVQAEVGVGLLGDCHADSFSPRQVLLVSADTYQRMRLPPATLRENVTLSADLRGWLSGSVVSIGNRMLLRIMFPCDPCSRLNRHRIGLMRVIGTERGVLARVVRSGTIRLGDSVRVRPAVFASWSDVWQERVQEIARRVPDGAVLQNAQLALLAGVPSSYCRVFARVLAAKPGRLGRRVVAGQDQPSVPRWSGSDLFDDEQLLGS